MENQYIPQPEQKKSNLPLIIGIAAAALLCCCCCLAVVGIFVLNTSVSNVFENIEKDLGAPQGLPQESPSDDSDNGSSSSVPMGGLGNEILRRDVWGYVQLAGTAVSCEPADAASVYITVTQEIDENKTWAETWSVVCANGETKDFDISYQQDETGIKFTVTPAP